MNVGQDAVDLHRRRAGVLVPLSALRRREDCGIGDVACLPALFDWMRECGLSILNVLPLNDLAPSDSCPYTALSAFAMDPAYVSLQHVSEFQESPRLKARLEDSLRSARVMELRNANAVRFADVRAFKLDALGSAFRVFQAEHLERGTQRDQDFGRFLQENDHWIETYALFRALKERTGWTSWTEWPEGLRGCASQAVAQEAPANRDRMRFYQYLQWIIRRQWDAARADARRRGILLYGDIPFGLNRESADVWAWQGHFDLPVSMGAPPDQYSATGQAWGLPAYRWDKMEADGHPWWRRRVRHAARLYDLFRLDHAVGFFRTWVMREPPAQNEFDISDEGAQKSRGERFFRMCLDEGAPSRPIAEDLGLIPPFVHEVLARLGIPGYRVTRWESDGENFRNPSVFPPLSLATTGNHDTSTLAAWWDEIGKRKRDAYWAMATSSSAQAPRFSPKAHETLLANVYGAGSSMVVVPFQDLFGTHDRINVPGTIDDINWAYRTHIGVEALTGPKAAKPNAMLRRLAEASGRA
jgi:4-alpha-glucanotransferase